MDLKSSLSQQIACHYHSHLLYATQMGYMGSKLCHGKRFLPKAACLIQFRFLGL